MIDVVAANPRDPEATALLQQSHALMQELFDPEDNHYLDIEDLCAPNIAFFTASEGRAILGTAALAVKGDFGEVKSMFVDPAGRGKGVGAALLQQLENTARTAGLAAMKLETGDKLTAAHRLYARYGFQICGPFGDYAATEASIFMEKPLS